MILAHATADVNSTTFADDDEPVPADDLAGDDIPSEADRQWWAEETRDDAGEPTPAEWDSILGEMMAAALIGDGFPIL